MYFFNSKSDRYSKRNNKSFVEQKYSIDAAVVLRIVCDLGILAPHNFAPGCDQPQLAAVHFDDGDARRAFGKHDTYDSDDD